MVKKKKTQLFDELMIYLLNELVNEMFFFAH